MLDQYSSVILSPRQYLIIVMRLQIKGQSPLPFAWQHVALAFHQPLASSGEVDETLKDTVQTEINLREANECAYNVRSAVDCLGDYVTAVSYAPIVFVGVFEAFD